MTERTKPSRDILKQQSYFVAKRNDLVQKSHYELTTDQNRALLYLISKIKPDDTGSEVYEISVREFCQVCNIDPDSRQNIEDAKQTMQAIANRSVWFTRGNKVTLIRWLKRVELNKDTQLFEIEFSDDILPYLYNLRTRYVQYSLENILTMKSRYGMRLYELLKSYEKLGRDISFSVDELRQRLGAENYTKYPDFKRRVLDTAMKDINEYSDIEASYTTTQGKNRTTETVIFSIQQPDIAEMCRRMQRKRQRLEE